MKNFYCEACGSRVYFQNSVCLRCGCSIALDLDKLAMVAVSGVKANAQYRLCRNATEHQVCNWAVPTDCDDPLCYSCRLNDVIPDQSKPENRVAWSKIEAAKRRLVYNLERLGLRPLPKSDDNPKGLSFRFLEDSDEAGAEKVLTGHAEGVVTLNIAEADDVEREKMRAAMNEPYRTLVGHLRHEVGHYYWEQLVVGDAQNAFRELFGDETVDYGESLKKHYDQGPPAGWEECHISAYASAHPWEDWAETWAHYLHIMDSVGTAYHSRLKVEGESSEDPSFDYQTIELKDFDSVIKHWPGIVCLVNGFNRSLGTTDPYPFVLAPKVVEKLRFIHQLMPANKS